MERGSLQDCLDHHAREFAWEQRAQRVIQPPVLSTHQPRPACLLSEVACLGGALLTHGPLRYERYTILPMPSPLICRLGRKVLLDAPLRVAQVGHTRSGHTRPHTATHGHTRPRKGRVGQGRAG